MNAPERFTLQMTRFIRAPRDKVFDAFTTDKGLASWMGPRGMKVQQASAAPQVGGAWQVEMLSREGTVFQVGGRFTQLQRPASLAYTWQWLGEHNPMAGVETLIEIELLDKDGGTELHMTHSGFPAAAARDGHNQGWTSTFNRLSDALDPEGSAGTITLLGDPRSTYTRTVRLALAEKGIAYTLQNCGPHTPEVMAIHPFGRIPALRDGGQPDRAVIDKALSEMPAQFAALDQAYAGREFLAGASLSTADLLLAPILACVAAMPAGDALLQQYPNVTRAHKAMTQRPSFVATQA